MIWIWDPVELDCRGMNETAPVEYLVRQSMKVPVGFVTYCDPDCHEEIIYSDVTLVQEDAVTGPAFDDSWVIPPPPGGVTYLDLEARDAAGNQSTEACP